MVGPWGHMVACCITLRIYSSVQPRGKADGEAVVETFERVCPLTMRLELDVLAL